MMMELFYNSVECFVLTESKIDQCPELQDMVGSMAHHRFRCLELLVRSHVEMCVRDTAVVQKIRH
jgi:hypothetical protein